MMTTCAPTRAFAPRVAVTASQRKSVVVYSNGAINPDIKKDEAKVVDTVVASEMAKPMVAYCRCWRSKSFPMCDGAHVKHNEACGDNVGPLLVKKE